MTVVIVNNCSKKYRPNPERIIRNTLKRIPEKFLKPNTDDEEILAFQPSRIHLKWAYFGIWNPVKIIIEFGSRISFLRKVSHRYAEKTLKGADKNAT